MTKKIIRRAKYTPEKKRELVDEIASIIANGNTNIFAVKQVGVLYKTFRGWLRNDPGVEAIIHQARREYLQVQVERMNVIADTEDDVARAKLKCDNIKWEASRVCRKMYGDKVDLVVKNNQFNDIELNEMKQAALEYAKDSE